MSVANTGLDTLAGARYSTGGTGLDTAAGGLLEHRTPTESH